MNNNELLSFSLTIYNPEQCSYSSGEYIDLHDVYLQALNNPELIYQIEVFQDFIQTLFQVKNRISYNIEIIHYFEQYETAKKFAETTNGTLEEMPIAWIVEWIDLTDEHQEDYFIDEYNCYADALSEYNFWLAYENQSLASVKPIQPVFA